MNICCIVMAAGASSRFGENKLLQNFLGRPLFAHVLDAAAGVFDRAVVVTGYEPVKAYAENLGFLTVENKQPALGVSRTIRLGLEQAMDTDGALFMTADQPLLSKDTLRRLAAAFAETPDKIISAACGETHANPCIFPRALFSQLLALSGDVGGSAVIRRNHHLLRLVQVPAADLVDCDTPEALLALEMSVFCEKTEEKP